jgi:hypothetical protein
LGWTAVEKVGDVLDLAAGNSPLSAVAAQAPWDLIIANLFLHHFEGAQLDAILQFAAQSSRRFLAFEPRRGGFALACSHMIGAIGVNSVTRQDSVLSVRAGFAGKELTALWPRGAHQWHTHECNSGLFSHCFRAYRAGLD